MADPRQGAAAGAAPGQALLRAEHETLPASAASRGKKRKSNTQLPMPLRAKM